MTVVRRNPALVNEARKIRLVEDIRLERQRADRMPVQIGDIVFSTDAETRARLIEKCLVGATIPDYRIDWKCHDGVFRSLSHADLLEILRQLDVRRQACFDHEKRLIQMIDQGSAGVDVRSGWPC